MADSSSGDGSNKGFSPGSTPEKVSKNKRKNLYQFSPAVPMDLSSLSLTEFPRYESLSEKSQNPPTDLESISERPDKEEEVKEFEPFDWEDPLANQLEELLLNNLRAIFENVIQQLIGYGYSRKAAECAVLKTGLYHGLEDPVLDTVFGALAYMGIKNEFDTPIDHFFKDLDDLMEYTILEMICVLREVNPSLSVVDAMWWLLICDLNLSLATIEGDFLSGKEVLGQGYSYLALPRSKLGGQGSNDIHSKSDRPHISEPNSPNSKNCLVHDVKKGGKSLVSIPNFGGKTVDGNEETKSQTLSIEAKTGGSKKGRSSNSMRGRLRQKSLHLEKPYKGVSKGSSRSKHTNRGGSILDKILKAPSDSSGVNTENTSSKTQNPRPSNNPSVTSKPESKICNSVKPLDYYYVGIPYDKSLDKYDPRDEKDKKILKLAPRLQALQKELESWNSWAKNKITQATRRLSLQQAELKLLRQEKEKTGNLDKEKHILEDNTEKRLSDMESALANAKDHVETTNSRASVLEVENASLKTEMDGSRFDAIKSSKALQEALMREQEALKNVQLGDVEKGFLQEELTFDKREVGKLQKEVEKEKGRYNELQGLFENEEREKKKIILQATTIREERERLEALSKADEDKIKQNAEEKLQKYKEEIQEMETEISVLRTASESSKIAELRRSIGGSSVPALDGYHNRIVPERPDAESVRWERECVMCMTNEISVVFLPCAHQVLCAECDKQYSSQVKDCPSCRARIDRRISVLFGSPHRGRTKHRSRAK